MIPFATVTPGRFSCGPLLRSAALDFRDPRLCIWECTEEPGWGHLTHSGVQDDIRLLGEGRDAWCPPRSPYFSEALGNATTEQLTHGTTRRGVLPHQRTTCERPVLRPLLSPEEFADTPDDGAILITTGLRPARVWLPRWFDRPAWLRADPFARLRSLTALPMELEAIRDAHRRWVSARWPWVATLEPSLAPGAAAEPPSTASRADAHAVQEQVRGQPADGDVIMPLAGLLRALVDAQTPSDGSLQARAFDFRGRLTKLVLSRDVFGPGDAHGSALLQRCFDAGVTRPADLQIVLPEWSCRRLPADLQAALRRRFGSAGHHTSASSRALQTTHVGASGGTEDLPRLALERLGRWVQEHAQHFDGHPARAESAPRYGVYQHGELVAVSLRFVTQLLARFTQGGDPRALWDTWRARGWLRHDPDGVTLRLRIGDQRRRWLALTWAAWQAATGTRASETSVEGSEHETHSSKDRRAAAETERHAGRDAAPAGG